jgi:tetratricopeptide (TPR) repeat protein
VKGYSASDVAALLGISVRQVRAYAALLGAERGPDGSYRFRFPDLVLLRAARELVSARVPARTVRRALRKLRQQLPKGRPLSAVRIAADGREVVVQDGDTLWNPESGQVLFDFAVSELSTKAAPLARRAVEEARRAPERLTAEDWYLLGCDLETGSPKDARDAYRRAVELEPHHADAHVNLGRLLHEDGHASSAATHYRIALQSKPDHAAAAYNLGVALEDLGRRAEALAAYEKALEADPGMADAHYNAALLYERAGKKAAAIRHLKACRNLVDPR